MKNLKFITPIVLGLVFSVSSSFAEVIIFQNYLNRFEVFCENSSDIIPQSMERYASSVYTCERPYVLLHDSHNKLKKFYIIDDQERISFAASSLSDQEKGRIENRNLKGNNSHLCYGIVNPGLFNRPTSFGDTGHTTLEYSLVDLAELGVGLAAYTQLGVVVDDDPGHTYKEMTERGPRAGFDIYNIIDSVRCYRDK